MPVVISLLRGVNVGGHNKIPMDALRDLCQSLGLRNPQTYVQSGNVVFTTAERNLAALGGRMEQEIEKKLAVRTRVILRTAREWREVIARNPFAARAGIAPNRLLVTFLAARPSDEARARALAIQADPEELHVVGRELYTHYPNGMASPKLSMPAVERALGTVGTGRNWNTVLALHELAGRQESGK